MDPLLDRIAERRALLTEQAQRLGKELAEVEAELERVAAAEQVVAQLLAEHDEEAGDAGRRPAAPPSRPPRPALAVPHRAEGTGVDDLPADYQRIMAVVAEEGLVGQGVACKRVTAKLGLTAEHRHIEGVPHRQTIIKRKHSDRPAESHQTRPKPANSG